MPAPISSAANSGIENERKGKVLINLPYQVGGGVVPRVRTQAAIAAVAVRTRKVIDLNCSAILTLSLRSGFGCENVITLDFRVAIAPPIPPLRLGFTEFAQVSFPEARLPLEPKIGEVELWLAFTAPAAPDSRHRTGLHQSHTSYYAGRDFRRSFDEMRIQYPSRGKDRVAAA